MLLKSGFTNSGRPPIPFVNFFSFFGFPYLAILLTSVNIDWLKDLKRPFKDQVTSVVFGRIKKRELRREKQLIQVIYKSKQTSIKKCIYEHCTHSNDSIWSGCALGGRWPSSRCTLSWPPSSPGSRWTSSLSLKSSDGQLKSLMDHLEISFESSASSTTTTPTAKTTTRVCQVGWSGGELDVRSNTLLFPEGDLKFTFNKRE